MTPEQYCQQKAAQSGSSFYYSFLFLPPPRRRAITALYAFCREVDDVVDEGVDPIVMRAKLTWWREEIQRLFEGNAEHPVTRALAPVVRDFHLQAKQFQDVIDGMAMDLEYNRYPDFATLSVYCHRVAGVVGLMAADIFGRTQPDTLEYARQLGLAFQLTNIIRDVGEDARRNRIYFPLDELQRFGVTTEQILKYEESAAFSRLMAFQIDRAELQYQHAYSLLPTVDRRAQRPGLVMASIYRALLSEIEAQPGRVLNQRISLTPLRKLWLAWKTWISA
jgi:phytoene synthase